MSGRSNGAGGPPASDRGAAAIARRVLRHELDRRGIDDPTAIEHAAAHLPGDDDAPLGTLLWRTLDPAVVEVRSRMLAHIGLLPRRLDATTIAAVGGDAARPTDRWILANTAVQIDPGLGDGWTGLRFDDPARSSTVATLDARLDDIAEAVGGHAARPVDQPPPPVAVAPVELDRPADLITASPAPLAESATAGAPELSVVLVTYGTDRIVIDAIASLIAGTGAPIEIVVVDQPHPTAGPVARRHLLLDTRGVRVLSPSRNLGFGGGCELGILQARGDVIALVNPDVVVRPGWDRPLLDALDRSDVSIAAPVLLDPWGEVQEAGQRVLRTGWTEPWRGRGSGLVDVDFASAACWMMRRAEHERLGGFDPAFHPAYYEDADLAFRARRLGGRTVVVHDAAVVHRRGRSVPATAGGPQIEAQHAEFLARWSESLETLSGATGP